MGFCLPVLQAGYDTMKKNHCKNCGAVVKGRYTPDQDCYCNVDCMLESLQEDYKKKNEADEISQFQKTDGVGRCIPKTLHHEP